MNKTWPLFSRAHNLAQRKDTMNRQVKYKTCIFDSLSVTKPEADVSLVTSTQSQVPLIVNQTLRSFNGEIRITSNHSHSTPIDLW